ncbi:winged helix-turn-helix transcriptional regulator [Tannockella kyphosi]|uniref:winged helix-turn-helix transcriptional regulator n=1 Tax=Tannockella kyphosi TaxID=2899121 RepID=UPI002011C83B|nr:helix-turn-helix domain-containing protein [Tannockella kyphosi]
MKIKKQYTCALLLSMDLLGGKWKMRILWHILNGDNRFSLLQRGIPDITHKMLVTQLKELELSNILVRTVVCEKPLNVVYSLSPRYKGLIPLVEGFCDFSKEYASENEIMIDNT